MSDHFTHEGFDFTMEIVDDNDHEPPWESGDGYGVVLDWRHGREKAPYERLLNRDRNNYRFYDMRATRAKAIKERWGIAEPDGLTRKQIIAAAVEKDFQFHRGWCNGEWRYVGVVVQLVDGPYLLAEDRSLWDIESNSPEYIEEVKLELANELLPLSRIEREMRKAVRAAYMTQNTFNYRYRKGQIRWPLKTL